MKTRHKSSPTSRRFFFSKPPPPPFSAPRARSLEESVNLTYPRIKSSGNSNIIFGSSSRGGSTTAEMNRRLRIKRRDEYHAYRISFDELISAEVSFRRRNEIGSRRIRERITPRVRISLRFHAARRDVLSSKTRAAGTQRWNNGRWMK